MIDIEGLKIKSQELGLKILNSIEELNDFTGKCKIDFIDELGYKYSLSTQNISTIYGRKTRPNIFFNYNTSNIKLFLRKCLIRNPTILLSL